MKYEEPKMEIIVLDKDDILTLVSGTESGTDYSLR